MFYCEKKSYTGKIVNFQLLIGRLREICEAVIANLGKNTKYLLAFFFVVAIVNRNWQLKRSLNKYKGDKGHA